MAQTIPEYFNGKHILITGGTGFMGKVLVEKLLRSCSDLNTLYLLIRSKKGKSAEERWQELLKLPLFDKLRRTNPLAFEKVKIIEGTVCQGLNLSVEDRKLLEEKVGILYHGAAAVQFTDDLIYSFKQNTAGTYYVAEFAKSLKNLKLFVHISSTYANCDKEPSTVKEEVYPTSINWRLLMDHDEKDYTTIAILKHKLIGNQPTTYTFTKALAETVVNDYSKYYPVIICRPSLVTAVLEEPLEGWVDIVNGMTGNLLAGGSGMLRVSYIHSPDAHYDYVSVDHAIKAIIIATWQCGQRQDKFGVHVLNCNYGDSFIIGHTEIYNRSMELNAKFPFQEVFWYPFSLPFYSKTWIYNLCFFLLNVLPALLADGIMKISGKKPRLTPVAIKITNAFYNQLVYFLERSFTFPNKSFKELPNLICETDKKDFFYDLSKLTTERGRVLTTNYMGLYRYIVHLDPSIGAEERIKQHQRLKFLHYAVMSLLCIAAFCTIYKLMP